jgi:hypothetical protein
MKPKKRKQRGRRRRSKATFPAKFDVGNQVRVKPGTRDSDFEDIPLGGWAGTISEIDRRSNPPIYLIEWNQHTLDHMHPIYRYRAANLSSSNSPHKSSRAHCPRMIRRTGSKPSSSLPATILYPR